MFNSGNRKTWYAIAALALAACGGDKAATTPAIETPPPASVDGAATSCATCKVIPVKMVTSESGTYYFEPKDISANEGDVLRFILVSGVHNVNFLPDSNPRLQDLPSASDMMYEQGQIRDVPLDFGTGRFYFQCDPHAMLGMIGHVNVGGKK